MNSLKSRADPEYRVPRLRAVVADDPRLGARVFLQGPLHDRLHVRFRHRFTDLPVDDVPAEPVQHAGQVIKSPRHMDVGNIHMPVVVSRQRLHEARAFLRG